MDALYQIEEVLFYSYFFELKKNKEWMFCQMLFLYLLIYIYISILM